MRHLLLAILLLTWWVCAAGAQQPAPASLGVEVRPVDEALAREKRLAVDFGAYVIGLEPGSPAKGKLAAGDVITSVNGARVDTKEQFDAAVRAARTGETLLFGRSRPGEPAARIAVTPGAAPAGDREGMPAGGKLMIDTGGHTALIRAIAFTPDGRHILSAGDDKVIRVWDLAKGKTIRTIRGESGVGDHGKIYAMALSPNGKWLAVGGYFAPSHTGVSEAKGAIRLYDFESGELKALLKGHKGVVYALAFSNDGKQLISGSGVGDRSAIVWDIASKKPLQRLQGHIGDIYAAGFSPEGKVAVTGSADHTLRLWRVEDGSLIATLKHKGEVAALAVSSRADRAIASGDSAGEIRLWDWQTGRAIKTLADQHGAVGSIAFSSDCQRLLAACAATACGFTQSVLDVATGKLLAQYGGHDNSVLAAAIRPDGTSPDETLAATAGGDRHEIHVWSVANGSSGRTKGAPAVFAGAGRSIWAVGFSSDGKYIGWGTKWARKSPLNRGDIEYWLRLPQGDGPLGEPHSVSSTDPKSPFAELRAFHTYGPYALTHREGNGFEDATLDIMKDGDTAASITRGPTDGYRHSAYTFAQSGKTIVSGGGGGMLIAYDLTGKEIRRFYGHESDVWAIAASPDGRYLVSGSADQTVRLWNLKTAELIVTLFQGADGAWVMWTPQGFFASSPGADVLIDWDLGGQQIQPGQLRKKLYRPDIVARSIALASSMQAVKEAAGGSFTIADILAQPVPKLEVAAFPPGFVARGGSVKIDVEIGETPDPVRALRIQVNGRQIVEDVPDKGGIAPKKSYTVPLARGDNTVSVIAINDIGEKVEKVKVVHEGDGLLDQRGTLYILAIGVNEYPGLPGNDLAYAGDDARAFAEAMEKTVGALHKPHIVKRVLINGGSASDEPTRENIIDALDDLKESTETDTILLFVAGHGENRGLDYYFVPSDANLRGGELRASTLVPWDRLQRAVESAKGARLLFLDTCHSGNAYNPRALNESVNANILVYTATSWDQEANETAMFGEGHGLFTMALTEGVQGKAKSLEGEVRAEPLHAFLRARIGEYVAIGNKRIEAALNAKPAANLTKLKPQEPQLFKGRDAGNYLLAIVK